MDFYFATKLEKFIKNRDIPHSIATLIKHMAMKLMSRHLTTLSRHNDLKIEEKLCRDKRQLCCDTNSTINFEGQEDSVATEKFYVVT